jgi:hypothetical protein
MSMPTPMASEPDSPNVHDDTIPCACGDCERRLHIWRPETGQDRLSLFIQTEAGTSLGVALDAPRIRQLQTVLTQVLADVEQMIRQPEETL